jgi:hypothetical protein
VKRWTIPRLSSSCSVGEISFLWNHLLTVLCSDGRLLLFDIESMQLVKEESLRDDNQLTSGVSQIYSYSSIAFNRNCQSTLPSTAAQSNNNLDHTGNGHSQPQKKKQKKDSEKAKDISSSSSAQTTAPLLSCCYGSMIANLLFIGKEKFSVPLSSKEDKNSGKKRKNSADEINSDRTAVNVEEFSISSLAQLEQYRNIISVDIANNGSLVSGKNSDFLEYFCICFVSISCVVVFLRNPLGDFYCST